MASKTRNQGLTEKQKVILVQMRPEEWHTSEELGCSVATLNSMEKKGFVHSRNPPNRLMWTNKERQYKLSHKGRLSAEMLPKF